MKILLLCTYPVGNPSHGGQLRAHNIATAYRGAGHHVEVAGVLGSESYPPEEGFDAYPGEDALSSVLSAPFLMEDWAIGKLYAQDKSYFERLAGRVSSVPDVIHVEQPWLWGFARRYAELANKKIHMIYGSQNVEHTLKKSILAAYVEPASAEEGAELVKRVEMEAIREADAVVCVSKSDLAWVESSKARRVTLAPNGVAPWKATESGVDSANRITQGRRFALYCASAHLPNIVGFFDIFGGGFGSLAPDQRLVIAGGAGACITASEQMPRSALLSDRVTSAGVVDKACLDGLLDTSHCIVLPITQGGGTNLKTAEALWSGKHVVATTVAMRGFECFMNAPGVAVADGSAAFKRALRSKMQAGPIDLDELEWDRRRAVLWEQCLQPLPRMIEMISESTGQ